MAWFAMNNWGLFPMSHLSKAAPKTEEEDDGSVPVRQLRGSGMVSTPQGKVMDPESPKFQRYDPKRHEAEYRAIVDRYGVSSKEARHFHLRNRGALAATLSDGTTNNPDRHTDYASVYGDSAKSNARLAHVQGSGQPSAKDAKFHAKHGNSSLDPDPELHDAISDYAHKLQNFIQRAYTMAAGRGGSAGGGASGHGASMEQVVGQLVQLRYKASATKSQSSTRSDEEEEAVEQALKGAVGATAAQHSLAIAGPVLRALQKAKDAAKKVMGADGKPLDLYKDRLLTAPAYFHEIFSKVGTTNPTDVPLAHHHYDAAEWGKVGRNKRPIEDYYGFLKRLKPGEHVPVTATQKAGIQATMTDAQRKKNNSSLVTDRVEVNPATDMMDPKDRDGATAEPTDVTRREYGSNNDSFRMRGRTVNLPDVKSGLAPDAPFRAVNSHQGVSKDITHSHGGENAPVQQGFDKMTEHFDVAPGDVRHATSDSLTAISGPHEGYNPADDDFTPAPGSGNLGSVDDFGVNRTGGAGLFSARLAAGGDRLNRVVGVRGSAKEKTRLRRPNQSSAGEYTSAEEPTSDAE